MELDVPGTGSTAIHRTIYDGMRPARRDTHRHTTDRQSDGPVDFSKAERTRFLPLNPSGGGPIVYADDDETADVNFTERKGAPWFWYRAYR